MTVQVAIQKADELRPNTFAEEMKFITKPIGPVSLIIISISDTKSEITTALTGPKIRPPVAITVSLISKVRKLTGILKTRRARKANALSIAILAIFLTSTLFNFFIFLPFYNS